MTPLNDLIGRLNLRLACRVLILLPALFVIFHILIIAGILPRNIVWGGRLTDATLLPLEVFAIVLNLLLMLTGGVAGKFVTAAKPVALVQWIKWFLFYFVVVNTVAGLFSTTTFEVLLTPITALYALCLFRIIKFPDALGGR